jgi:hypothetical protein
LRVECTLFCYLQSREQTQAVLVTLSHPGPPKVKKNIYMCVYVCVVGIYLFNQIQLKSDSYQLYY